MGYYIVEMHVMQNAVRAVRVEFAVRLGKRFSTQAKHNLGWALLSLSESLSRCQNILEANWKSSPMASPNSSNG